MNLSRHAAVLWRFRLISATGLFLGVFLAVFASYTISFSGGPSLTARSGSTFGSDATLLVTQPGFPEGRVTLPVTPTRDPSQLAEGQMEEQPKDRIEYADPGRFGSLADLYSQLAMSDRVRGVIPEKPKSTQIQAFALAGASGGIILPVIKLTVTSDTKDGARVLSEHTVAALRGVLKADQDKSNIPANSRVELRSLNSSTNGYIVSGPSRTASILVLILCILGTIGLTHLLAALRDRDTDATIEGIVDPWAAESKGGPRYAPEPASLGWSGSPAPAPPAPAPAHTPARRRSLPKQPPHRAVSATGAALQAPGRSRPGSGRRAEVVLWVAVALTLVASCGMAIKGRQPVPVLALFVCPLLLITFQRTLLAWQTMLGFILLIILFIPIRRYTVGGGLPIELEPYRVVIAIVLGCWIAALAADPDVRWRKTGLEAPIALFAITILLSLTLNIPRVNGVSDIVLKQVSFFVSFFLILYFVRSVLHDERMVAGMLKLLVGAGTLVAILALVEWKSGVNVFNGLGRVLPFLHYMDQGEGMVRGTGVRALGSAQHPIALGAALVMLLPLTVYLNMLTGRKIWFVCAGLLTLGALSTGSRTAAIMLIVLVGTFFWLRRDDTIKMLPTLFVLLCVIQVVMPGTIGTFKAILNPAYVIKEQSRDAGNGSGRLADVGPSLAEWSRTPLLGQGFGTRVPAKDFQVGGQQILDDQWLGSLLEIGAVGVFALWWIFIRAIRRLARLSRRKEGPEAWLATTLAASLLAFAIGMFTFDAFAFIQVTFFAFIMLGFSAVITRDDGPLLSRRATKRAAARA